MNAPADKVDGVVKALPAMKKPTVSKLYGLDYYAIETVVEKNDVNVLIPKLKEKGAEDILEMRIDKIVR